MTIQAAKTDVMIIVFSFELLSASTKDIVGSVSSDVTVSLVGTLSPALIIPSLFPFSTSILTLSYRRFKTQISEKDSHFDAI